MTVEGYDLSHWDGINEYSLAGKGFVIIKVTEGTGYVDPARNQHLAKAKAQPGIIIGSYHFARDDASIDGQAKWYVDNSPAVYTFLVVDNEGPHVMTDAQCTYLIQRIRLYDTLDRPILLYMSDSAFMSCGQDYNYVAKWSSTPPRRPWLIWQYMSGSQAGSGGEDRDRYAGTQAQLASILGAQGGTIGDDVNSYPVPKQPTIGDIGSGKTIWPNDVMDPADTSRIIISPARIGVPVLGMPTADKRIIEYVDDKGVHSGKAYWVKTADLVNVRAATTVGPAPDCTVQVQQATTPLNAQIADLQTQTSQQATVIEQQQKQVSDAQAAEAKAEAEAAVAQAQLAAAQQDLANAAQTERERIAQAEKDRINGI